MHEGLTLKAIYQFIWFLEQPTEVGIIIVLLFTDDKVEAQQS